MELDFTSKPTVTGDHFLELEKVRAGGAVTRNSVMGGWMVVNYLDVRNCLSDSKNFTSEGTAMATGFGPEAMLVQDGPVHNALRNVWAKQVSPKTMESKRSELKALADAAIAALAARLHAGEVVDLVNVFENFTTDSIIHIMGVRGDRRGDFQRWNRTLSDLAQISFPHDHPKAVERRLAKAEIFAMLGEEVERRRTAVAAGAPVGEDLVSLMTAAEGTSGIHAQMVIDNLLNLLIGALDTTVKWMGNTVAILRRHPAELAKVLAAPSFLPKVLEEVLRYESVVQLLVRKSRTDEAVIAGTRIPAGDIVYLLPGAANRDPTAFANADVFEPERKSKPHLGFGYGLHVCLGMNFARLESEVLLNRIFAEVPGFIITEVDYGDTWLVWGPRVLKIKAR